MNVSQSTQVESVGGKMTIIKTIRRTVIIFMLDITDQLKHKQVFVTNQICIVSVVPPSCVLMPTDPRSYLPRWWVRVGRALT